jgi:hypothetical protein
MARLKAVPHWLILLAALVATSSRVGAQVVTIDFFDKGTVSTANFRESTLASTPELNRPLLSFTEWNGLGVVGGTLDSAVDAGESVLFALDLPATGVSYYVQFAQDSDSDGKFGETEVEGYGAGGVWLGTVAVNGVGSQNISAAFGNQPLTAVRVRPVERIRIYSLSFNSGSPVIVGFHDKSTVSTASFRGSGLTITPELNRPLLSFTEWNGLGVVGGTLDSAVDAGESVLFALDLPATGVSYYVQFAQDSDSDGKFGETEVEGYGAGGVWLGTVAVNGVGSQNISAAFGNQPLTAVRVRPVERIRIYSLSYSIRAAAADFNRDGISDILWRHGASGDINVWFMSGAIVMGDAWIPRVTDQQWQIVGIGDFNGDGNADILWRYTPSGDMNLWFMSGTSVTSDAWLPRVSDPQWKIAGIGDFNKDGKADIVWRNTATGDINVWFMNGGTVTGDAWLPRVIDQQWQIVGTGDFNRDGGADIVWRYIPSGDIDVWLMNGIMVTSDAWLPRVADPQWQINTISDFNGDGNAEIVWRHTALGIINIWFMNGVYFVSDAWLPRVSDPLWKIFGPR